MLAWAWADRHHREEGHPGAHRSDSLHRHQVVSLEEHRRRALLGEEDLGRRREAHLEDHHLGLEGHRLGLEVRQGDRLLALEVRPGREEGFRHRGLAAVR